MRGSRASSDAVVSVETVRLLRDASFPDGAGARGGVRAASRAKLRVRTSPARSSARRREVDAGHRESFRGEGGEGFEGAASRKIS
jgi:hypothetical protein